MEAMLAISAHAWGAGLLLDFETMLLNLLPNACCHLLR